MPRTILLTGATSGIGLETAHALASHRLLLHGRSAEKLARLGDALAVPEGDRLLADLSDLTEVRALAAQVADRVDHLDALINNAGVLQAPRTRLPSGLDLRLVVNTLAPIALTEALLPKMGPGGRVVNVSSAGQHPVDLDALTAGPRLDDFPAYAQSKLALTQWSAVLADELGAAGPVVVAVNPGSLLDTPMVQAAFGRSRRGPEAGAEILARAATSAEFAGATGRYYDNDAGAFGAPHPHARDLAGSRRLVARLRALAGR